MTRSAQGRKKKSVAASTAKPRETMDQGIPGTVDASPGTAPNIAPTQPPGGPSMFSAATFFDVIDQAPAAGTVHLGEPSAPLRRPTVVAFYGFRGGAGRTLSLAHSAVMLARRGMRIVALDLDVEAPGLHVALGVSVPQDGTGTVRLLREAITKPAAEYLPVAQHLLAANVPDNLGKLLLLPAGCVTRTYLAEIEELGVGLWHAHTRSPLQRLLDELRDQEGPDAVFIDCRTGFSGLAATALFHVADIAVIFLPLSEQIWEGVDVLLEAARAAKSKRANHPALLFVPSMVPTGPEGRKKVDSFVQKLRDLYVAQFGELSPDLEVDDPDAVREPWLQDGIAYDPRISVAGCVDASLLPLGAWGIYRPLVDRLVDALPSRMAVVPGDNVDSRKILDELKIDRDLAFAESTSIEKLVENFVAPFDVMRAIDRSTALIVGAKGSGKTWLWRYLINDRSGPVNLPEDVTFVVGHAPEGEEGQDLQLSADAIKELETECNMRRKGTHKAFWLLYGLARLSRRIPQLSGLPAKLEKGARAIVQDVLKATTVASFRSALARFLSLPGASTMAEDLLASADALLLEEERSYCLSYDGLDTGFETGRSIDWRGRQDRFVTALLLVLAEWRPRLKRIQFKVFLREDIYLGIQMQNRSHLDATKHELRWRPEDLWRIALNIATTSASYVAWVKSILPGIEKPWPVDDGQLRRLLFRLWGERIESGKNAYTASYIETRMADATKRLFPRTLVQMIYAAIDQERKGNSNTSPDRVIGHPSLRHGVEHASEKRVEHLKTEYRDLAPFLDGLKEMSVTGTEQDFIKHLKGTMKLANDAKLRTSQDWQEVIKRLQDVGVLGIYQKGHERAPDRLAVAQLYRHGLKVKQAGLR